MLSGSSVLFFGTSLQGLSLFQTVGRKAPIAKLCDMSRDGLV